MRPIGIPDMDAVFQVISELNNRVLDYPIYQTFPETLKKSSLVKINFHVAIEEFKVIAHYLDRFFTRLPSRRNRAALRRLLPCMKQSKLARFKLIEVESKWKNF